MSVIIYTYRDPYKLKENKELWKEISSCPYFCVAQTLVNGLKAVYGAAFQIGRVTTVKNLTDILYEKWNGTACAVKQHADIDNINSSTKNEIEVETLDHIVIQGVHQFSPLLLRAIEEIAKYKKVILLINYQEQYKNIYQTWIDIYSAFDCEIQNFDGIEYYPVDVSAVSYDGNLLAHNIGKLIGGHKEDISVRKPYEIIEFDNMTEFASYVLKNTRLSCKREKRIYWLQQLLIVI